jgi:hypothetical protein
MMRTCSRAMPRIFATSSIHIWGLSAGLNLDTITDAAREARLGLNIGMLDETRLESAFDNNVGRGEARHCVATGHATTRQDVAGTVRVNAFSALFERLIECRQRRQRAPGHRKRREIEMAHRLIVTDHKRHGLAAKAY